MMQEDFLSKRWCDVSSHPGICGFDPTTPALEHGYTFTSSRWSEALARHQHDRQPCVIRGCFSPAPDSDSHKGLTGWLESERVVDAGRFEPMLWIDREDRVTQLHYDNFDNQMFMVSGTKVFVLYPPEDHGSLYHPFGRLGRDRLSPVCVERPDLKAHPHYINARPVVAVIKSGDMLYIPADWSHKVYTIGCDQAEAIGINYWYPVSLPELWRRPSSHVLFTAWASLINLAARARLALTGVRSAVPDPAEVLYVHSGDRRVADRYQQNLDRYRESLGLP